MSRLAQLPLPLLLPLLLLLLLLREVRCVAPTVVVGSSRRKPKNTKTDRLLHVHSCSMSPREILVDGDQLALLLHRGLGGSPRVVVQHVRVVIGETSYYHGTIHTRI